MVLNTFYLDTNGVTVKCPGLAVGDTFTLGVTTYTRRDLAGLRTLVGNGAAPTGWDLLPTSCTTGVTDMQILLAVRVPPPRLFLL